MAFQDWIYSVYPANSEINGRWGTLHIITIILCIIAIVAICFLNKKSLKTRQNVITVLAAFILLFEVARRVINFTRVGYDFTNTTHILGTLLPRPWCAISCWTVMLASVVKKTRLYNLASMCALLNALVFFAYPSVGFNDNVILFENLYSIVTHSLLIVSAVSMITLRLTDFSVSKKTLFEALGLAIMFIYAFAEIYLLKIEPDPMYFLQGNDVQDFLGVQYNVFLVIYVGFLMIYFSTFYLVQRLVKRK